MKIHFLILVAAEKLLKFLCELRQLTSHFSTFGFTYFRREKIQFQFLLLAAAYLISQQERSEQRKSGFMRSMMQTSLSLCVRGMLFMSLCFKISLIYPSTCFSVVFFKTQNNKKVRVMFESTLMLKTCGCSQNRSLVFHSLSTTIKKFLLRNCQFLPPCGELSTNRFISCCFSQTFSL